MSSVMVCVAVILFLSMVKMQLSASAAGTPLAVRVDTNPLITPDSGVIGDNINGPSIIAVPEWVGDRLGAYYMYFAHHNGQHIRLAYADNPAGPWRVHPIEILPITSLHNIGYKDHIASPDVHVDHENQQIVMYFHAPHAWPGAQAAGRLRTNFSQLTGIATSRDALTFQPGREVPLSFSYLRAFHWRGTLYGLSARALVFRLDEPGWGDGTQTMVERVEPLGNWRHAAVHRDGDRLFIFYSRWGDAPERIVVSYVDLQDDWNAWTLSAPVAVLRPNSPDEGNDRPLKPSTKGAAKEPLNELRDPAYFEHDGQAWLYYSIAGESGISAARLHPRWQAMVISAEEAGDHDLPDCQ